MNRRELFASFFPAAAAIAAATGIESAIAPIESGPLCLVVTMDADTCDLDVETVARIKAVIAGDIGPKCPPVIVLAPGMKMEPIYHSPDARAVANEIDRRREAASKPTKADLDWIDCMSR